MEIEEDLQAFKDELSARMTLIEFAIEVLMANQLTHRPEQESAKFKEDFIAAMGRPYGAITSDLDEAARMRSISERSVMLAQQMIDKVLRREHLMRN